MNALAARAADLAERLAEAEATIEALLSGQVDAVVDVRSQTPLLLSKAQEALRQSEERYRRIVETTREGVWIIDAAHKTTFMNRRMAEMLRCEPVGPLASSPFDFLDEAESGKLAAYLQRTKGGQIDIRFTRTDGTDVWTLFEAAPVFDLAGRYEGSMAMVLDITERKQAEFALVTAEERMRFALESADVGLWDMDYTTGVLSWSPTLERQYGVPPGTFAGTFAAFAALVHPEDRTGIVDIMTRAASAGTDFSVHHRIIWADGTVRSIEGSGRIHLDQHGKPLRGVGVSLDVTERRLLEKRYQMASKMDAIGQLASGVAHDFNNLLTVILGFTEFVMEDPGLGDSHRRDLGETIKAAGRASVLTKQLLAFSRQQVLETTPIDLNKLITDMTGMLRRLIGEHIDVTLTLAPQLPLTLSDRGQLEQVVMNLLVNARDAMPAGGRVTIKTSHVELDDSSGDTDPVAGGHYVLLAISDNGSGMSAETQRRLFEPFFTTKETGKGTGLGLSTAYGIIKQSKGYIFADSQLERGTTFRVYLPCADQAACIALVEAVAVRPPVRASETILLVEDEPSLRELSRRCLEREGYRVLVAENGNDADRRFGAQAAGIDLLLTDVVMPGCGGPELATRLRLRKADLKVIYMSGYTEQSSASDRGLTGPALLQKPFTAANLRRRVRDVLDHAPQI